MANVTPLKAVSASRNSSGDVVGAPNALGEFSAGDVIPPEHLGSGSPSASTFLRGDGAWASPGSGSAPLTGIIDSPTVTVAPNSTTRLRTGPGGVIVYGGLTATEELTVSAINVATEEHPNDPLLNAQWNGNTPILKTPGIIDNPMVGIGQTGFISPGANTRIRTGPGGMELYGSITIRENFTDPNSVYFQALGDYNYSWRSLRPNPDNSVDLGGPGYRWRNVYSVNGTIQTSDGRHKTDVAPCALGLEFIQELRPVCFRWSVGGYTPASAGGLPIAGTRMHHGLIAQEVKATIDKFGVDFGGWILSDPADPDSTQGLRYTQFIAPLINAVQEVSSRLEDVSNIVDGHAADIDDATGDIETLFQEIETIDARTKTFSALGASLQNTVEEQRSDLASTMADVDDLLTDVDALDTKLDQGLTEFAQRLAAAEAAFDERLALMATAYEARIAALEAALTTKSE